MPITIRLPSDLAEEIDRRRGLVPRERYVRELLRQALDMSGEEKFRQRIEKTPVEAARQPPRERRPAPGYELPKIAPRRT